MGNFKHHTCIVCSHVFDRTRPVLLNARDLGYPPEFMCGADDHYSHKDGKIVGYSCLLEHNPTLAEVGQVPEGFEYERKSIGGGWTLRRVFPEP